jgi:hypothetical protein
MAAAVSNKRKAGESLGRPPPPSQVNDDDFNLDDIGGNVEEEDFLDDLPPPQPSKPSKPKSTEEKKQSINIQQSMLAKLFSKNGENANMTEEEQQEHSKYAKTLHKQTLDNGEGEESIEIPNVEHDVGDDNPLSNPAESYQTNPNRFFEKSKYYFKNLNPREHFKYYIKKKRPGSNMTQNSYDLRDIKNDHGTTKVQAPYTRVTSALMDLLGSFGLNEKFQQFEKGHPLNSIFSISVTTRAYNINNRTADDQDIDAFAFAQWLYDVKQVSCRALATDPELLKEWKEQIMQIPAFSDANLSTKHAVDEWFYKKIHDELSQQIVTRVKDKVTNKVQPLPLYINFKDRVFFPVGKDDPTPLAPECLQYDLLKQYFECGWRYNNFPIQDAKGRKIVDFKMRANIIRKGDLIAVFFNIRPTMKGNERQGPGWHLRPLHVRIWKRGKNIPVQNIIDKELGGMMELEDGDDLFTENNLLESGNIQNPQAGSQLTLISKHNASINKATIAALMQKDTQTLPAGSTNNTKMLTP